MSFIEMIKEKIAELMGKAKAEHPTDDHKTESTAPDVKVDNRTAVQSEEEATTQVDETTAAVNTDAVNTDVVNTDTAHNTEEAKVETTQEESDDSKKQVEADEDAAEKSTDDTEEKCEASDDAHKA